MKRMAFLFLIIAAIFVPASLSAQEEKKPEPKKPEPVKYPMKNVPMNSAKFQEIFSLVTAKRAEENRTKNFVIIVRKLAEGIYLVHIGDGETPAMLAIPGEKPEAGNQLTLKTEKTDTPYTYTDDSGSKQTVDAYKIVPEPEFTPTEFRDILMMGESFLITKTLPESPCDGCNGFGRIPDRGSKRSGDGKIPCPKCDGSGKVRIVQEFEIIW